MSPKGTADLEAEAAEILRSVGAREAALNQTAFDAAREGEQARQNARKAAELARRFATQKLARGVGGGGSSSSSPTHAANNTYSTTSSAMSSSPSPPRLSTQAKLLNLSLELERCQRALAEEKSEHKATQQALAEAEATATKRQAELEALLHDLETAREEFGRKNDELQRELDLTKQRLEAADQDASLALELAQSNATAREEMEAWYQQCLDRNTELQGALEQQQQLQLQNGGHETNQIVPQVANDENASREKLSPAKSGDSMVASGRELLKSFRNGGRQMVLSPTKAAKRTHERRRQLTERLKAIEPANMVENPRSEASINSRISKLLQESGRRLSLPGRWWKKLPASTDSTTGVVSSEDTESLTQHYCQAVEVSFAWLLCFPTFVCMPCSHKISTRHFSVQQLVERKNKDLFELQAYCELVENSGGGAKN